MAKIFKFGVAGMAVLCSMLSGAAPAAPPVSDDFNSGSFNGHKWRLCQADQRLLWFDRIAPLEGSHSLTIGVDADTPNKDRCSGRATAGVAGAAEDEGPEALGPSLIFAPSRPEPARSGILSTGAGAHVQRNELRLRDEYRHPAEENYWYGFSFRLDGKIPPTGSTRWVIGQWKHTAGPSPVLAQRFDNGVFHVTVQDGHCRCMVAKADGDPDLMTAPLTAGPLKCVWAPDKKTAARAGEPKEGDSCETGLTVERGENFVLPDPKEDWVNMIYSFRGGRDGKGRIDIYANWKFVARVTGPIGYENWRGQQVKFKIGMYRDYIDGDAHMHFDRFWVDNDPTGHESGFKPRP